MRTYTEQEKINHVSAFMESGLSKVAYSERNEIPKRTLFRWCEKYKSAEIDNAKLAHLTPDKQFLKKATLHYDANGKLKQMWLKTDKKLEDTLNIMKLASESFAKNITPQIPTAYKGHSAEDLLSLYITTDYHMGMLATNGDDKYEWSIDIAKELLVKWYSAAIAGAPDSHTGVMCNLGDALHCDGLDALTPASGHALDADGQYSDAVDAIIEVFRQVVEMMLIKHEHVHIIHAEGNHDPAGSAWLRAMFHQFYIDNPRVTVDRGREPYYAYAWGECSLFFHHGHKRRMGNITSTFCGMFRELWGKTKHSFAHMGHMHHKAEKEETTMLVRQHRTLAAPDDYAKRGGWMSGRSASVTTYHKKFGEVGCNTLTPEMVM